MLCGKRVQSSSLRWTNPSTHPSINSKLNRTLHMPIFTIPIPSLSPYNKARTFKPLRQTHPSSHKSLPSNPIQSNAIQYYKAIHQLPGLCSGPLGGTGTKMGAGGSATGTTCALSDQPLTVDAGSGDEICLSFDVDVSRFGLTPENSPLPTCAKCALYSQCCAT